MDLDSVENAVATVTVPTPTDIHSAALYSTGYAGGEEVENSGYFQLCWLLLLLHIAGNSASSKKCYNPNTCTVHV